MWRRLSLLSLSEACSLHAPLMASQLEDESLGRRRIRQRIFNTQLSLSFAIPLSPLHSLSLFVSLPPSLSLSVIFFPLVLLPLNLIIAVVCVCVGVCVCLFVYVYESCIRMAGAQWIKEQKLLTFRCSSSDTSAE